MSKIFWWIPVNKTWWVSCIWSRDERLVLKGPIKPISRQGLFIPNFIALLLHFAINSKQEQIPFKSNKSSFWNLVAQKSESLAFMYNSYQSCNCNQFLLYWLPAQKLCTLMHLTFHNWTYMMMINVAMYVVGFLTFFNT